MNEAKDKNILLSYSPGNFFYVRAQEAGVMPDINNCTNMDVDNINWDISCNKKNYSDNADACFKKELCKNKKKVHYVQEVEAKNSGANRKYLDVQKSYTKEYLYVINLGIGIVLLVGAIIKYT